MASVRHAHWAEARWACASCCVVELQSPVCRLCLWPSCSPVDATNTTHSCRDSELWPPSWRPQALLEQDMYVLYYPWTPVISTPRRCSAEEHFDVKHRFPPGSSNRDLEGLHSTLGLLFACQSKAAQPLWVSTFSILPKMKMKSASWSGCENK